MIEGKIVAVNEDKVVVRINVNILNTENILNKYVIFNDTRKLVGEVGIINNDLIEVHMVGIIENNKFSLIGYLKPSFTSTITLATKEDLDIIFETSNSLKIGINQVYNDYPVLLELNNFFSNHFGIFGNSGSGKSYAVSSIIEKIFNESNTSPYKSNIFIFDIFGEYADCFSEITKKFNNINCKRITTDLNSKLPKLNIPFYLLDSDDIALLLNVDDPRQILIIEKALDLINMFKEGNDKAIEYKNDILAKCVLDIIYNNSNYKIRTQVVSILSKFYTNEINLDKKIKKGGWEMSLKQCLYVDDEGKIQNIDLLCEYLENFVKVNIEYKKSKLIYYTIDEFYNALEYALISEGVFISDKVFDYANILKVRLDNLIKSKNKEFFICNNFIDKNKYICDLLIGKNNEKYQIINFNISELNDRFAKTIVKILSRWFFEFTKELNPRAEIPIHIVLEEAHRYIQEDSDTKILGYNIFDRIAKEGRKYGVLLGVISQRPSELSETVLSQLSNALVFKTFNRKDINAIEFMLPSVLEYKINRIRNLPPGLCITIGNAFKIPVISHIDMPIKEPNSKNVNIMESWYK